MGEREISEGNTIDETSIHVFIEGGIVTDITRIPKDQKVIVIDWDADGVEPEKLTILESGEALVTTWQGKSTIPDQITDREKLREYMQSRDVLECYVLSHSLHLNRTIIKPCADMECILIINGDDNTEEEFESLDDMAENNRLINLAFRCGAFYVYGYELGGC